MNDYILSIFLISIILAFLIGAQEETMSTTIGSGSLSIKFALIFGALFIFLGAFFLSDNVGTTLGADILYEDTQYTNNMMFSVLTIAIIWMLIGAFTAVPISLNQTVVGAIFGVLIVQSILIGVPIYDLLNINEGGTIITGWIISAILAYLFSGLLEIIIQKVIHKRLKGLRDVEKKETYFRYFLIGFVFFNQMGTAGNQAGNALGMIYGLENSGDITLNTVGIMALIISAVYVLGFLIFGKKLIKNIGNTMGNMRPSETFAVEISTATIIFIGTILGIPLSAAQVLVFSILGTLKARAEQPKGKSVARYLITWLILLPSSMMGAGLTYYFLSIT